MPAKRMNAKHTMVKRSSALTRIVFAGLAQACFCAVVSGSAHASPTHTLTIGATVLSKNNCRFNTPGPTALDFGAIDPSSVVNKTATATTIFRCVGSSPMANYLIVSDDGLYSSGANAPRMRHAVNFAQFMPYTITMPQSGTVPKNTNQTLTVTGTVLVADFQNALAGAYSDTVILTISP